MDRSGNKDDCSVEGTFWRTTLEAARRVISYHVARGDERVVRIDRPVRSTEGSVPRGRAPTGSRLP